MNSRELAEVVERIHQALLEAGRVLDRFTPGEIEAEYKAGYDPVTEADRAVDTKLRQSLLRSDEGWLSEETVDDRSRLGKRRVWIVDPLDGTREFVAGIPEFCVSVAMVDEGRPVAGGILNPAKHEIFLGSETSGVTYNGKAAHTGAKTALQDAVVLASRSESGRGEWKPFENASFKVQPMGSVAYKLALVSAGLADATFTLTPKHEWDVAGGVALVESGGGVVRTLDDRPLRCNQASPKIAGLIACSPGVIEELKAVIQASSVR
ncbi:MAG TPA: 3'(2'),5'-bisphosphate nucleotidase CysQ [Terriglobales bacterium]|jgi:myo-inositol-1(or 4)-monophosphatase